MDHKHCIKCLVDKPLTEFNPDRNLKDGRKNTCKTCLNSYRKAYYYKTHEGTLEYQRSRYDRERETLRKRKWYSENRGTVNAAVSRRRAAKVQATPTWLSEGDLEAIRTEYSLAAWCSEVMGTSYHVDHVVPLRGKSICGLHVPWNLQVIPASDNIIKSNKWHDN